MKKKPYFKTLTLMSESAGKLYGAYSISETINGKWGNCNFLCGYCGTTLFEKVDLKSSSIIKFNGGVKCFHCESLNDVGSFRSSKKKPILKRDVASLPEQLNHYYVSQPQFGLPYEFELSNQSEKSIAQFMLTQDKFPNILQHYTSNEGLMGMLSSGSIWATDATFLNDSSEYNLAKGLINNYIEEKKTKVSVGCAELLDRSKVFDRVNRDSFFVACFCANPDLLSQWRGYANAGTGYSIGISNAGLVRSKDLQIRKVVYDLATQKQLVKDLIDRACFTFEKHWSSFTIEQIDEKNAIIPFTMFLSNHFKEFLSTFKHEAFKEENEFRLVFQFDEKKHRDILKFRPGPDRIIPYIDIPLNRFDPDMNLVPVVEITCGPTMHPELATKSLHQYLSSSNYFHVEVNKSSVPFRT
jgi:hypothetical protein